MRDELDWVGSAGPPHITDAAARELGVRVLFTGREGGVSEGGFRGLNLSTAVGDDPSKVHENRKRVLEVAGAGDMILARQVHGAGVASAEEAGAGTVEADALVLRRGPGLVGVLTADCVPVLLAGRDHVAAVHAGWRGLVGGVIEAAVEKVAPVERAWVGPSIHACCYEVGPEVIEAFRARDLPVASEDHVDPGRAAVTILHRLGVARVACALQCTSCDPSFFSHRRDGDTGRQGGFIAWT